MVIVDAAFVDAASSYGACDYREVNSTEGGRGLEIQ